MIKIGDFARLSQVSVVSLRYYDEIVVPYREIYIRHEKTEPSDSTTEIQFPVEKA